MSDAWDRAKAVAEKHAQAGGIFVRLANDGDKVVGAFAGDPYTREVIWTGSTFETHDPNNPAHADKRVSLRVTVNFFVPAESKMKVIEGGTQWFKDVLKVREKYGLDTWLFEIERHGEAGSTRTKYSIMPEVQIDAAMRTRIAAAELHDLENLKSGDDDDEESKPDARAATKGASAKGDGAKPVQAAVEKAAAATGIIDEKVAQELMGQLKQMPRTDLELFLKRFGVSRIRDLKAADESLARNLVANLVKKTPQTEAEVDAFA